MRCVSWRLGLAAACAAVAMFGQATPVYGAEESSPGTGDRLGVLEQRVNGRFERLEQRVNQIAQQQDQLLRRLSAQQERQAPMAAVGGDDMRQAMRLRSRAVRGQAMPPEMAPAMAPAPAPAGALAHDSSLRKKVADMLGLCCMIAVVFNILVTIWIFTDIRKRGEGSGIFIALALLAGIPTAIIYAIVRIGDKKA